jgi:putative glutamine amidotransferase
MRPVGVERERDAAVLGYARGGNPRPASRAGDGINRRPKVVTGNMRKPLIGIGSDIDHSDAGSRERAFVYMPYVEALRRAGAIPLLLPPQPEDVEQIVEELDGVLLTGGDDCDPAVYGEQPLDSVHPMDRRRQENDLALSRAARNRGIPTLGICLGSQVMNVAAGGTLVQDIDSQCSTTIQHANPADHRGKHEVRVAPGSRLASILGDSVLDVNSSHHQSVRRPGEGLRVNASAPDAVIEGVEDPSHPFFVGVQWHPEDMREQSAATLFSAFVEAARAYAEARKKQP